MPPRGQKIQKSDLIRLHTVTPKKEQSHRHKIHQLVVVKMEIVTDKRILEPLSCERQNFYTTKIIN